MLFRSDVKSPAQQDVEFKKRLQERQEAEAKANEERAKKEEAERNCTQARAQTSPLTAAAAVSQLGDFDSAKRIAAARALRRMPDTDAAAAERLLAKEGVTDAELKRVKAQVVAGQIYKRDSVFGQGMEIGMTEMSGLSWRSIDRQLEKIKAVTSAQIQQVAKTYFSEDNLVVATLLPQPIDPNKPARKPVPGMREEGGLR